MKLIPLASVERILKSSGAERVSASGKRALKELLEKTGLEIAKKAWSYAQLAGRKTIKSQDIKRVQR